MRIQQQIFYSFLLIFTLVFAVATWLYYLHFSATLLTSQNQQVSQINRYIYQDVSALLKHHRAFAESLDKDGDVASAYDKVNWVSFMGRKFIQKNAEDVFYRYPYLRKISFLKNHQPYFSFSAQEDVSHPFWLTETIDLNVEGGGLEYQSDPARFISDHLKKNDLSQGMKVLYRNNAGNWLIDAENIVATKRQLPLDERNRLLVEGVDHLASLPLGNGTWEVRSLKPQTAVREAGTALLLNALAAYAISAILIFIIARYLSILMIQPVRRLEQAAISFMGGSYTPIKSEQNDETKPAIDAFNAMGERIKGFTEELQKQVKARTRELEIANSELALMNETDTLTRARNRQFLIHQMPHLVKLANRNHVSMGIAMLDLDHFKVLNDTFGHVVGDQCLVTFVQEMHNIFRRDNDWIIRYGGEEFCLICFGQDRENFASQLERFRQSVENIDIIAKDGRKVHFTVSIGFIHHETAPENWSDPLIGHADTLLYKAKNIGRNCVVGDMPNT